MKLSAYLLDIKMIWYAIIQLFLISNVIITEDGLELGIKSFISEFVIVRFAITGVSLE
jgi:hypothetical protein